MRRPIPKQDLESGQDSFLDVVSNIVGILIILVVVVGAQVRSGLTSSRMKEFRDRQTRTAAEAPSEISSERAAQPPTPAAPDALTEDPALKAELAAIASEAEADSHEDRQKLMTELEAAAAALAETVSSEAKMEEEIAQLRSQKQRMDAEQLLFADETVQLEARLRLIQKEMETHTSEQDLKNRALLQLSQNSVQLDRQLEELKARIRTLAEQQAANGGPKTIEHKMTPIVHSVDSREFHFILDQGRVLYVPLEELLKEYERRIPEMMPSLMQTGARTEVLGPYDGFRMRTETRLNAGRVGVYWQLVPPEIEEAGETIADALGRSSKFCHYLEKLNPQKDTLTFWIYPKGFSSFTTLKEAVYQLGFSVASRPLPAGTPIAGSPDGQRSVAQ